MCTYTSPSNTHLLPNKSIHIVYTLFCNLLFFFLFFPILWTFSHGDIERSILSLTDVRIIIYLTILKISRHLICLTFLWLQIVQQRNIITYMNRQQHAHTCIYSHIPTYTYVDKFLEVKLLSQWKCKFGTEIAKMLSKKIVPA